MLNQVWFSISEFHQIQRLNLCSDINKLGERKKPFKAQQVIGCITFNNFYEVLTMKEIKRFMSGFSGIFSWKIVSQSLWHSNRETEHKQMKKHRHHLNNILLVANTDSATKYRNASKYIKSSDENESVWYFCFFSFKSDSSNDFLSKSFCSFY